MGFPTLRKSTHSGLPLVPSNPILNDDILPRILSHLGTRDLLNCCLAGPDLILAAGRCLYANTPVEYGREWEDTTFDRLGRPNSIPRNIFQGVNKPTLPNLRRKSFWPFNYWQRRSSSPSTPRPPFQPSPMKVDLLRHVRSLTYYCHPANPCDPISVPTLFSSLSTLTVIAHRLPSRPPTYDEKKWGCPDEDHPIDWTSLLLTHLRPKHLRLIHIPSFYLERYVPYPISSVFGNDSIEKITMHFLSCLTDRYGAPPRRYHRGELVQVDWPGSLRRLNLVFMQEDEPSHAKVGAFRPVFNHKEAPHLREAFVDETAEAVAELLAAAVGDGKREVKIRVIGLGWDFFRSAGWDLEEGTTSERIRLRFDRTLRTELAKRLVERGLDGDEAERLADKLEMVSMLDYWQGKDYPDPSRDNQAEGIEGLGQERLGASPPEGCI